MQSDIIRPESAHAVHGVPGRLFTLRRPPAPWAAGTFSNQRWVSEARPIKGYGAGGVLQVEMRFDDECRNGHNTFSITADVRTDESRRRRDIAAGGCLHGDIAQVFPELAPLIRWHLVSTDGPTHYLANTLYLAGDADCHGLRKGEQRPIMARDGVPHWELVAVNAPGVRISTTPTGDGYRDAETLPLFILAKDHKGAEPPPVVPRLEWRQCMRTGEGKARELGAARDAACWPEATDEQLSLPRDELRALLEARLPALLAEFRAAMTASGFAWSPDDVTGV